MKTSLRIDGRRLKGGSSTSNLVFFSKCALFSEILNDRHVFIKSFPPPHIFHHIQIDCHSKPTHYPHFY